MDLTKLRLHVGEKFSLDYLNAGDERNLIDDWANEAVEQFLLDTGIHVVTSTIAVTSGTGDYPFPFSTSLLVYQIWVTSNSMPVPLEPISPEEMITLRRSAGSDPVRYYSIVGDLLQIYPTPTANGNLQIMHTPVPTALSTGADDPETVSKGGIPSHFHLAMEYWMSWRAGSHTNDGVSKNGQDFLALYEAEIRKTRARIRRASGKRLAPAKVGPPNWRGLNLLGNSQDITHR